MRTVLKNGLKVGLVGAIVAAFLTQTHILVNSNIAARVPYPGSPVDFHFVLSSILWVGLAALVFVLSLFLGSVAWRYRIFGWLRVLVGLGGGGYVFALAYSMWRERYFLRTTVGIYVPDYPYLVSLGIAGYVWILLLGWGMTWILELLFVLALRLWRKRKRQLHEGGHTETTW